MAARKEPQITTPNARSKLKVRGAPYYRLIHAGLYLGYRKSKTAGRWLVRAYAGDKNYVVETLADADDGGREADGVEVLDFQQAQDRARERETEIKAEATGRRFGPYTVADALDDYLRDKLGREGRDSPEARRRCADIASAIGEIEVSKLTKRDIREWMEGIANSPPKVRGGKFAQVDMNDPEVQRRRRDTANRYLNDVKAALNFAVEEDHVAAGAWRDVKPYKLVSQNRPRFLSLDEITRLLNASPPDLRALVNGGLLTGARRGDLVHMRVADFVPEAQAVTVGNRKSRYKGKSPFLCYLSDEGARFFEAHTAGRDPQDPMFVRDDGRPWREDDIARPLKAANKAAKIEPPASFNVLRHTYASLSLMNGMSQMAVAQNLGHSDTRMVEKHYGHLTPDWRKEQARHIPEFGIEPGNVKSIRGSKR
jgi:integrase